MICFRDRSFCSDADRCSHSKGCSSYFSPEQKAASVKWWGDDTAPVAFASKKDNCSTWSEVKK